ncbi:fibronectin type III domain-containing protein [Flavisolibacter tropicus]|uniref:Fibronectin n=1 Tax=Flavisolibacter tropicus TaxID=1492898 RepID=A0A172U1C2_9BACT|nr:hypothetical protein [Flavisolibacter tropicus]ANE52823.1 hypothetical protein SY85_22450 [Flavisolibacter tropicus]
MKKAVSLLIAVIFLACHLQAQQREHRVIALANPKGDSIVLRWAPASFITWQMGNKYGYWIERFVIAKDGNAASFSTASAFKLNNAPLRPWPEAQMENAAVIDEKVAIVKEAIYSKDFQLTSPEKNIGNYITQQGENDVRYGFAVLACDLSPLAAQAAALRIVDRNVKKGERYAYRISVAQQPKGLTIEPGIYVTSVNEPVKLSPPQEFAVTFDDRLARLQWLSALDRGIYTAYVIERSTDGKSFHPLTDLPVINGSERPDAQLSFYTDSLTDNETTYYYRIKGITPFGETGPYSTVVSGLGKPIYDRPFIDTVIILNNQKLQLRWTLSQDLKKKTQSIYVSRATKAEGPYQDISPLLIKDVVSYVDEKPYANTYYRLKIKTIDGQTIYSLPQFGQVIDTIPPGSPTGLQGAIDQGGKVQIKWTSNAEADLQGYRVFRANALHEEFVEVTDKLLTRNAFVDSVMVETLSEKVHYRVVAVDKNFNPSDYSAILTLARPDKIAPSAPVFITTKMVDSIPAIQLAWKTSTSGDVMRQELYRVNKLLNQRTAVLLDTTNQINQWIDTTTVLGHTYYYELIVSDEAGNSVSTRTGDIYFETGFRPAIKSLTAQVDRMKKQIVLEWKERSIPDVYYIYKSINNQPLVLLKKVDNKVALFIDAEIKIGNTYTYKIKGEWGNGNTTHISKPITITY